MKVRIIHTSESKEDILGEEITFTDDFETDAADYCIPGWHIMSDSITDMDLPPSFPLNHSFRKSD